MRPVHICRATLSPQAPPEPPGGAFSYPLIPIGRRDLAATRRPTAPICANRSGSASQQIYSFAAPRLGTLTVPFDTTATSPVPARIGDSNPRKRPVGALAIVSSARTRAISVSIRRSLSRSLAAHSQPALGRRRTAAVHARAASRLASAQKQPGPRRGAYHRASTVGIYVHTASSRA